MSSARFPIDRPVLMWRMFDWLSIGWPKGDVARCAEVILYCVGLMRYLRVRRDRAPLSRSPAPSRKTRPTTNSEE